jgi:DNA modification methylase
VVNLSCVIEPRAGRSQESTRRPIPFDFVHIAQDAGYKFLDDIVWQKPDGASGRAVKFAHHRRPVAYKPFTVTEYLLVFRRADGGLLDNAIRSHDAQTIAASLIGDGYERTNVWRIPPTHDAEHPAVFPLALAQRVVAYYSFVGDTVLDAFMGTGTTGAACRELGRRFVGIERDGGYFATAEHRLAQGALTIGVTAKEQYATA